MTTLMVWTLSALLAAAGAAWTVPPEGSCNPTGGLRGGPTGEDAPPVRFEPGDVISIGRLDVLRDYLPPELWEHRDRFFFEGMELEIGPCFRDYSAPDFFSAATRKFAGQATLTGSGGLANHTAGLPFPPEQIAVDDEQAGLKWAWNAQSRYRAGGFRGAFRVTDLIGSVGKAEPFTGEVFQNQLAHRADRPAEGYRVPETGTRLWAAGGRYDEPFGARETGWLQLRELAAETEPDRSDDLHLYIPELRKVRRTNSQGVEGLYTPTFGVAVQAVGPPLITGSPADVGAAAPGGLPDKIEPKRSGFEGLELRPLHYDYTVLGVQDVLAPINAKTAAFPTDPLRSFGPYGLSWASDRWELRRAIVLQASRKSEGEEGELARFHTWYDVQTLVPLFYVSYDAKGEQIDVGIFVGRWSEDRPDYPKWADDPQRPVRIIDSAGAAFANLTLRGSWRRESWELVSTPKDDTEVRRSLSVRSIQKGR